MPLDKEPKVGETDSIEQGVEPAEILEELKKLEDEALRERLESIKDRRVLKSIGRILRDEIRQALREGLRDVALKLGKIVQHVNKRYKRLYRAQKSMDYARGAVQGKKDTYHS